MRAQRCCCSCCAGAGASSGPLSRSPDPLRRLRRYTFWLDDAIDPCPEYLVNIAVLERLAAEYGLRLEFRADFHQFYQQRIERRENRELFHRMSCVDADGRMSDDEWEALSIYQVVAFKRDGTVQPPNQTFPPVQRALRDDEVIRLMD